MSRLTDFMYELARQHLNEVHPVPLAPDSSTCELGGTQESHPESAGSGVDWALDTRATCRLTDVEVLEKMNWQLMALRKREGLRRAFEVPTVYPEAK